MQLLLQAGAFLTILGVGAAHRRDGTWAVLAAIGGLLAALSAVFLPWARMVGLVLIAGAFVVRVQQSRVNPLNG